MSSHKLLWIINKNTVLPDIDWRDALPDFYVTPAAGISEARALIAREEADCVLVNGLTPTVDSVDILEALHRLDPTLPVVFWDPEMGATDAVRLIRAGAFHCVGYRDGPESLKQCLESAVQDKRFRRKAVAGSTGMVEPWRTFLVGESRAMQSIVETVRLIGPRRCTVLITGETGTGKEMVARALHGASPRASQPMVTINCGAIPEHLLEAELFGHVKGAFTGAINSRVGRFEQAHKSTLFLDEVGDMPLDLQAKLLRVLQDHVVQRLGGTESVHVDVRVIAASNRNLLECVRQGKFREDLYYRLNVVPVRSPALRERETDIPLLVDHFVQKICRLENVPIKRLSPETMNRLRTHAWPGNVRQLENAVEMAIAMSGDREVLFASDFGLPAAPSKIASIDAAISCPLPESMDFDAAVSQFERALLERALLKTAGNKTAAAELLGLKRTTLIMKLRNYDGGVKALAG